jgi:hypothetical protein
MENEAMERRRRAVAGARVMTVIMIVSVTGSVGSRSRAAAQPASPAPPAAPGSSPRDEERGLHVEVRRLDITPVVQVWRSPSGPPRQLDDGDKVTSGELLRVSVRSSADAQLYLAFCAHDELTVYPPHGAIPLRAGRETVVPDGTGAIVVDQVPGQEVIYVIVSRTSLADVDRGVARALTAPRRDRPVHCDASLDAELIAPGGPARRGNVLRGTAYHRQPPGGAGGSADPGDAATEAAARSRAAPPPDPDFERSAGDRGLIVSAGPDGVAIVRYRLRHVAP